MELFKIPLPTLIHLIITEELIHNTVQNSHPNAAVGIPFDSIRSTMLNRLNNHRPLQSPTNLLEYVETFKSNEFQSYLHYDDRHLNVSAVEGTNLSCAVILMDIEFAKSVFNNAEEFFIDVSQKIIPLAVFGEELITLLCVKKNYAIPCAWAVTNSKSKQVYKAVLQEIRSLAPQFSIKTVITSYDDNLQSAIREVFPDVNVYGSLLHYMKVN
ncbi:uncharacterized protein LOC122502166 [Leptopilina heterotoma]|uniref:uncharacterized protein LOC122502166 n=1 Tax=Leptopilina heterotoma TaxID=63436 RepID=UPI001CA96B70|nr:uncharacterized protein LOC122502166 [Leptopilina heterotoma]